MEVKSLRFCLLYYLYFATTTSQFTTSRQHFIALLTNVTNYYALFGW
jgi:hypothetical protein